MSNLHILDIAVVLGYLAAVIVIGKIATHKSAGQEDFFLAGRKLGRVYQFFLNFGNATDAMGAVSTVSTVYRQGASGTWIGFQNIFLNPYYWFMNAWFRRVRLTTTAELFEDRLGSRRLPVFYAIFQIFCVIVLIGFSNLVAYKICAGVVTKPQAEWTAAEHRSVSEYRELARLKQASARPEFTRDDAARLTVLREAEARGELHSYITAVEPWSFYILYTAAVGFYIIMGGMAATAINEALQGVLIVAFSTILIPAGLSAVGGWDGVAARTRESAFNLFEGGAGAEIGTAGILAMFLTALLQVNGLAHNMAIGGSARSESSARFGAVAGTFMKRLLMILWTFAGLIAIALFSGSEALSDPDLAWGTMSQQVLGPGMVGLMLAGVLAANMSTVAAQTMAISALFSRDVYSRLRPGLSDSGTVAVARWFIVVVLLVALVAATQMRSVYTVLQLYMTLNVSFGCAVLLMFFWRRLTVGAVWVAVVVSATCNTVLPLVAEYVPAVRTHAALVPAPDVSGPPDAVFFENVVRTEPGDPGSAFEGRGRLHCELVLLASIGFDVTNWSPSGRFAARFFVDALLPLVLLVGVSLPGRAPPRDRVDRFFGKMKTPVGATPELEAAAMAETQRNPGRFDHRKLWRGSSWEFTKWDREDTIGFVASCLMVGVIIGAFVLLLRWASMA